MDHIPRLVQVHSQLAANTSLVGIATASEFELFQFAKEYALEFPLLADGESLMDAYGIDLIWGSVFYLVDAQGAVLAAELEPSIEAALTNATAIEVPTNGSRGTKP